MTALHRACLNGHREAILVLLEHGARTDISDERGRLPAEMESVFYAKAVTQGEFEELVRLADEQKTFKYALTIMSCYTKVSEEYEKYEAKIRRQQIFDEVDTHSIEDAILEGGEIIHLKSNAICSGGYHKPGSMEVLSHYPSDRDGDVVMQLMSSSSTSSLDSSLIDDVPLSERLPRSSEVDLADDHLLDTTSVIGRHFISMVNDSNFVIAMDVLPFILAPQSRSNTIHQDD